MALSLALIAEGNAETLDCWSGSGQAFVQALRRAGASVDVYDVELRGWRRGVAAALAFHPDRARWHQRYGLGAPGFAARSGLADLLLSSARRRYDAVIQIGGTFRVSPAALRGARLVVYADGNIRFARRAAGFSGASLLSERVAEACAMREALAYRAADRIWTMSRALADSFRDDFGIPEERLLPVWAGSNTSPAEAPAAPPAGAPPSVLFVGKDHRRKGSDVLLDAWPAVRRAIPGATLHLVGGEPPRAAGMPGVVVHGFVSRRDAAGAARLAALYAGATVFCLPSRYEPFGLVFVEAMLAGLPCVGTDRWAMPEIIVQGETGWLVPDGDAEALAATLVGALADPVRAREMGARGRARALARFTWDHTAARALADLQRTLPVASVAAALPTGGAQPTFA